MGKRLLVLIFLLPLTVTVAQKTFVWTPPTEREDTTPLPDAEIASYNIYCDGLPDPIWNQNHEPTNEQRWISPPGTFARGYHECYATTVDTDSQESGPSNTVNFIVAPPPPAAPVLVVQ